MDDIIRKELIYSAHNYKSLPVVLSKAKDIYVWDDKGNRYIDMMSAYSAVSCGHAHPRLVQALYKQAQTLSLVSRAFYNNKLAPLLEYLCNLTGFAMGIPMNSGAEAVETAIKAARMWGYKCKNIPKNKAQIIVAKDNFHGRTTTIISFSSEQKYKENFGGFTPGFKEIAFGDAEALKQAITKNTCALIVEPMQGEAGIIIPPQGWLRDIQKICLNENILLILDEVQTGLGRTGKLFAYNHEIDMPDGLIIGKALGGGLLPISMFLGTKQIMELFTPGSHGSTFGGNPLACAVAMETLNVIFEENLIENSYLLGQYFLEELKNIKSNYIKSVRGKGLWIGLELDTKIMSSHDFCLKLLTNGILTKDTKEKIIRLAPPLTITENNINETIKIIKKTLP